MRRSSRALALALLVLLIRSAGSLLRVSLHIQGKAERCWLEEGYELYRKRLAPIVDLSTKWHKTNDAMVAAVLKEAASGASVVLLDVLGKGMTSPDFSTFFFRKLEQGGSRACFVVGGAEGLPRALSQSDTFDKLSLGDMTLTHSFARTLLAEQIYRAAEIRKGSGYHKE